MSTGVAVIVASSKGIVEEFPGLLSMKDIPTKVEN